MPKKPKPSQVGWKSTPKDKAAAEVEYIIKAAGFFSAAPRIHVGEIPQESPELLLARAQERIESQCWRPLKITDSERRPYLDPRQYTAYELYEQRALGLQPKSIGIEAMYRFDKHGNVEVVEGLDAMNIVIHQLEQQYQRGDRP